MIHSVFDKILRILFFCLILFPAGSIALRPLSISSRRNVTGRWQRHTTLRTTTESSVEVEQEVDVESSSSISERKKLIEVSSEIELPFSAETAYDAYSNLTRQPTWSSWLHSVVYVEEEDGSSNKTKSKWTMKFMGFRYSWEAIAVKNERPHTIEWKSTSGLKNFGTVHFLQEESDKPTCIMTLKLTFIAPRAASAIFRRSDGFANFMQEKMVTKSMNNFRDIVMETDAKQKQ